MCVIINIENGKFPEYQTLKDAESLNDHGGSIAWLENGKINYEKGIKASRINAIITKELKPKNVTTAIIHFRIASVGKVNKKLCHPFPITKKVETDLSVRNSKVEVLFHNGTVSNWQEMLIDSLQENKGQIPQGELSDSRIIAFLLNRHGHDIIKESQFNKFAILTRKGIVKYGNWVKVGNNECSNDYFVKTTTTTQYNFWGDVDPKYSEWKKEGVKDKVKCNILPYQKPKKSANDQVNDFLKTKEDYKWYRMTVKEFFVTDDEILDHLVDGYKMEEVYGLFQNIYGVKSYWNEDSYLPAWERYSC